MFTLNFLLGLNTENIQSGDIFTIAGSPDQAILASGYNSAYITTTGIVPFLLVSENGEVLEEGDIVIEFDIEDGILLSDDGSILTETSNSAIELV